MTEIRVQFDLDHPVDLVWRTLTEPPLLARWFVEADIRPRVGAAFRLRAPALAGLDPMTLAEVTAVDPPHRLAMRWRSDQTQTVVTWELSSTPLGCRLVVTQAGFLGVRGTERRAALRSTYERLYGERLPAVLAELAGGPPAALPPLVPAAARPSLAARLPTGRGGRWLAVAGVAAAVAAIGTALSGLLPSGTADPVEARPGTGGVPAAHRTSDPARPGANSAGPADGGSTVGAEAGVPATAGPAGAGGPTLSGPGAAGGPGTTAATTGTESTQPGQPPPSSEGPTGPAVLSAAYRTINPGLLGVAAFRGGITVTNTGGTTAAEWSVAVTMPARPSAATADFGTNGTTHTFRGGPLAAGASVEFTYDVLLNLSLSNPAPTACAIGGTPCEGV